MTEIVGTSGASYYSLFDEGSWVKVHRALIRYVFPKLKGSSVKVLMHMIDKTYVWDRRGEDYRREPAEMSVRVIAHDQELSTSTVQEAIKELMEWGLAELVKPGDRITAATYGVRQHAWLRVAPDGSVQVVDAPVVSDGGVSEIATPAVEGVSEIATPNGRGVSEIATPNGRGVSEIATGVYRKSTRSIDSIDTKAAEDKEEKDPAPLPPHLQGYLVLNGAGAGNGGAKLSTSLRQAFGLYGNKAIEAIEAMTLEGITEWTAEHQALLDALNEVTKGVQAKTRHEGWLAAWLAGVTPEEVLTLFGSDASSWWKKASGYKDLPYPSQIASNINQARKWAKGSNGTATVVMKEFAPGLF